MLTKTCVRSSSWHPKLLSQRLTSPCFCTTACVPWGTCTSQASSIATSSHRTCWWTATAGCRSVTSDWPDLSQVPTRRWRGSPRTYTSILVRIGRSTGRPGRASIERRFLAIFAWIENLSTKERGRWLAVFSLGGTGLQRSFLRTQATASPLTFGHLELCLQSYWHAPSHTPKPRILSPSSDTFSKASIVSLSLLQTRKNLNLSKKRKEMTKSSKSWSGSIHLT